MKLSRQAAVAIMMAVQKGMMAAMENKPKEECDIVSMLLEFKLMYDKEGNIVVQNPPTIAMLNKEETSTENCRICNNVIDKEDAKRGLMTCRQCDER